MLFTNSILYDVLSILLGLLVILIVYLKWCFTYWKNRGVETMAPSLPFGNVKDMVLNKTSIGEFYKSLYDYFSSKKLPFGGFYFFGNKQLLLVDLDVIKDVVQVNFDSFLNHGIYLNEEFDPITENLFALEGEEWRNMRRKLTPTFTSGKIKQMFDTFLKSTEPLIPILEKSSSSKTPLELQHLCEAYTIDVIGSVGFGMECNSFEEPNSEFHQMNHRLLYSEIAKIFFATFVPKKLMNFFKISVISKDLTNFYLEMVKKNISYREEHNITRNDFMQTMIGLKDGNTANGLTLNQITAQCVLFLTAGYETSSVLMTCALLEISKNKDIQTKLREEVNLVLQKHDNKLTYDAIQDMKYLDKVINETLRKYPPSPVFPRCCTKDYKMPGYDVTIEKGTPIIVPVWGIHHDPKYYPNPDVFDPERFSEVGKASRPAYAFIPFGEGPRICIGLKLGMMQSKVGIVKFFQHYDLTVHPKTFPITYKKNSVVLVINDGLWVDVKKIN